MAIYAQVRTPRSVHDEAPMPEAPTTRLTPRASGSALLAAARLTLIFLLTLGYFGGFALRRLVVRNPQRVLEAGAHSSWRWARRVLGLMGVTVDLSGAPPPPGCLIAPNHFTWLDVIVLMSSTPMFFVSRDDVAHWPLVGFFTRQIGTVFLNRSRSSRDLVGAAGEIRRRLAASLSVVIFLEGTTSGGLSILPFKPSLVQTAIEAGARIVPTALRWRADRPGISVEDDIGYWRDDQTFGAQAWRLLGLSGVACEIVFGEPIDSVGRERKELAAEVETQVRRLYAAA